MTRRMTGTTITEYLNKRLHMRVVFVVVLFAGFAGRGSAQENDSYGFGEIQGLFNAHKHTLQKYSDRHIKPKNELEFIMASGFDIYKAFFSSQDNPSCVFYPSCSEYSVQAFREKGALFGTFYTFDRLSRCHHFVKPGEYYFDPSKQRFYDPVR